MKAIKRNRQKLYIHGRKNQEPVDTKSSGDQTLDESHANVFQDKNMMHRLKQKLFIDM